MGRILKRVPLDFNWPLGEIWKGYLLTNASSQDYEELPVKSCKECYEKNGLREDFCWEEKTSYCVFHNPKWKKLWHEDPPEGEGYQMWENTSEGSPQTPVFTTLKQLAQYCAANCSIFGDIKMTSVEWYFHLKNS